MKKSYYKLLIILSMILFIFTSCNSNDLAVISDDYSNIKYKGNIYTISDYPALRPNNSEKIESKVDGDTSFLNIPFIVYDDVYISDEYPNYLWLLTSADYSENEKFELSKIGNEVMYELIE